MGLLRPVFGSRTCRSGPSPKGSGRTFWTLRRGASVAWRAGSRTRDEKGSPCARVRISNTPPEAQSCACAWAIASFVTTSSRTSMPAIARSLSASAGKSPATCSGRQAEPRLGLPGSSCPSAALDPQPDTGDSISCVSAECVSHPFLGGDAASRPRRGLICDFGRPLVSLPIPCFLCRPPLVGMPCRRDTDGCGESTWRRCVNHSRNRRKGGVG